MLYLPLCSHDKSALLYDYQSIRIFRLCETQSTLVSIESVTMQMITESLPHNVIGHMMQAFHADACKYISIIIYMSDSNFNKSVKLY